MEKEFDGKILSRVTRVLNGAPKEGVKHDHVFSYLTHSTCTPDEIDWGSCLGECSSATSTCGLTSDFGWAKFLQKAKEPRLIELGTNR